MTLVAWCSMSTLNDLTIDTYRYYSSHILSHKMKHQKSQLTCKTVGQNLWAREDSKPSSRNNLWSAVLTTRSRLAQSISDRWPGRVRSHGGQAPDPESPPSVSSNHKNRAGNHKCGKGMYIKAVRSSPGESLGRSGKPKRNEHQTYHIVKIVRGSKFSTIGQVRKVWAHPVFP